MNKISNWLFGSFFRTIGRVIAFIFIGGLIAYFIQSNGLLDGFSIADLFGIQKVNAAEGETRYLTQYDYQGEVLPTTNTIIPMYYQQVASSDSITSLPRYFGTEGMSSSDVASGFDYVKFNFMIFGATSHNYSVQSTTDDIKACRQFTCEHYNSNTNVCSQWKCLSWYTVSNGTTISDSENVNYTINFSAYIVSRNNVQVQCDVDMNKSTITCPTWSRNRTGFNRLIISYSAQNAGLDPIYLGISRPVLGTFDSDQIISDKINSQTQQQQQQHDEEMRQSQQQHEETQSYLEDSNTSHAENEATEFFQDFSSTDHGGLSAIITAPLNTIRSLLNSTCTNLVLPLPFVNENLTLPCLNSIYTEFFGAFFTIYQTIILGIIAYKCIRSIYYDIHGFMDPNDDRIEVMDL